jgi:hypothetical protein
MKKYLLWTFERGSRAYDVICVVILAFIFLTPHSAFNDRRKCTRPSDPAVCQTIDHDGNPYVVVKAKTERAAVDQLKASRGEAVMISRTEPMYNAAGQLMGYSIWIQR